LYFVSLRQTRLTEGTARSMQWKISSGESFMELDKTESQSTETGNRNDAPAAETQKKQARPLKGFLIAGGSLAALFTIAYLKGRADN